MLKKFILAITCLITAGIVSAVELVKDGKPAASIILAEKPTRSAQMAAVELQYHIKLMTGATLEILKGKLPAKLPISLKIPKFLQISSLPARWAMILAAEFYYKEARGMQTYLLSQ